MSTAKKDKRKTTPSCRYAEKRYFLVQFIEDNIKFIVDETGLKRDDNNTTAMYQDKKYYPCVVLSESDDKEQLTKTKTAMDAMGKRRSGSGKKENKSTAGKKKAKKSPAGVSPKAKSPQEKMEAEKEKEEKKKEKLQKKKALDERDMNILGQLSELNRSVIVVSERDREVEEKEKELLRKKQDLDRREQEMETQKERQRQKAKKSLPEEDMLSSGDEENYDDDYENISVLDDSGFDYSTDDIDVLEASNLIQALRTTETVERPVIGIKRPRTSVLPGTSAAKKCPRRQQVAECTQCCHLLAQNKELKEANALLTEQLNNSRGLVGLPGEVPRAGKISQETAKRYQMIELSPGRGVYLFESHLTKAHSKNTATATACFLLSCFYSEQELIGKSLGGKNGKASVDTDILESILSFTRKKFADLTSESPIKIALRNKITCIEGLTNLGNTCFFNAVMQNLCQTELLHVAALCAAQEGFSQRLSPTNKDVPALAVTIQEEPGPVTKALWKLLQDFRSSSGSTLNPKQLFGEICKKATRFRGYRQQDSQELLRYLLDSIQIEELKRVKRAILKSFSVSSDDDSKMLDDNKRKQVKEYGACVEAPLIDSVFAGRFVSIVICRQCQQEFKVEETFLDLSLPLTAPQQESWNFNPFSGGKQNPRSPRSPKNNDEPENLKSGDAESETDGKGKNLSKHQLKVAKRADRKKGKKGKGHGKGGKGKTAHEAVDNKKSNKDDDEEEEEEKDAEGEDDELDQMNVSDLDGSDNEQEHKLNEGGTIDKNSATELPIDASDKGSEEMPDNNACVEDEKSSLQQSREMEEDSNSNNRECEGESLDDENEVSSMDISNSGSNEIISSKCKLDNFQRNIEDLAKNEPCSSHHVNQLSSTEGSDSRTEKEDQHSHDKQDVQEASGSDVLSNVNEIVKGIENLALNAGLEKEDNDFQRESVSKNSSLHCTFDSRGDDLSSLGCAENSLKDGTVMCEGREDEILVPTESLPGGNSENASVNGKDCSTGIAITEGSLNGVEGDAIKSRTNEPDAELVKNDEYLEQGIEITENQEPCTDSSLGNETRETGNATIKSEGIPEESETDSEDEHEHDSGANKTLTLQPAYHPSPAECSVMSCLSQFCASELLDGSNKFACEECSRKARRLNASNANEKERTSGDEEDDTDEDECKGAKAAKSKESKEKIVYTVATKQLLISLAPPVLTLHLKRFQQARFTLRKLTKHVDFPLELNLAPFCSRSGRTRADSEGQVLYSLYGVVQHSGNMNSGHYTAYVKVTEPPVKGLYDKVTNMSELTAFITNMWTGKTEAKQRNSRCRHEPASDGQWFHVSDSSVSSVPETRVLKSQAYMLFYRRLPLCSR